MLNGYEADALSGETKLVEGLQKCKEWKLCKRKVWTWFEHETIVFKIEPDIDPDERLVHGFIGSSSSSLVEP